VSTIPERDPEIITRIVLVMEYDGAEYYGFQFQSGVPTVQQEVEKAIKQLTGENRRIVAASRTDTGVHARGQVVSFRTGSKLETRTLVRGLNYYLPGDIAVKAAYRVDSTFHVQRDVVSREYEYYIFNSRDRSPLRRKYYYLVPEKLNIEEMNRAGQALIGMHDFASFVTGISDAVKSTVKEVYLAQVEQREEEVVFRMIARSYLPHQVRNTVGTLLKVGTGKIKYNDFLDILAARKPGMAGPTVPPHGLFLIRVNYSRPF
jgi:tRNA pseudouridine38-40 synthase